MEEGTTEEMQTASPPMKVYPKPRASHDQVFDDANLFWRTLKSFHSQMNINPTTVKSLYSDRAPATTDGKAVDLHLLYNLVTIYGGYEMVDSNKKWNEVCDSFNFVPPATNAAYHLKKHYFHLLYHYEQVYFFRREGHLRTPPNIPPARIRVTFGDRDLDTMKRKRKEQELHTQVTQQMRQMLPLPVSPVSPGVETTVDKDLTFEIPDPSLPMPPIPFPQLPVFNGQPIPEFHSVEALLDEDLIFAIPELGIVGPPIMFPPEHILDQQPISKFPVETLPDTDRIFDIPDLSLFDQQPISNSPGTSKCFGTIEWKFDCGYVVSVRLGAEVLMGVLYFNNPDQQQSSFDSMLDPGWICKAASSNLKKEARRAARAKQEKAMSDNGCHPFSDVQDSTLQ